MTMEETEKRLKELLSKSTSQEEILKSLIVSEGCGVKVWCQEQIVAGTSKKIHRYCGYVTRCDDPSENTSPMCGEWIDGACPGK